MTATYVVCLDAETGATRWVRYLGAASSDAENMIGMGMGMGFGADAERPRPPPALARRPDALLPDQPRAPWRRSTPRPGAIRWVATYPRQDRADGAPGRDRDLNPAVVHDGLVIVAPDDASPIYAFDAGDRPARLEDRPAPRGGQARPPARRRQGAPGRHRRPGPPVRRQDRQARPRPGPTAATAYEGYGRGLLAGDKIYWPTRTEIHVLDQATGLPAEPPIKLQETFQTTGGNLAVGDGYLIVAQADALVVFCQNSRLIERYRDEIARAPEQAVELLPAGPGGRGDRPGRRWRWRASTRPCRGPGRRRRSTACRWSRRPATTSTGS